jgi:phosphoribosylanthranilate isomerase
VTAVILLQDAPAAAVQEAIDALRPDLLQFHGQEPPELCESFGLPYLKAVAMQDPSVSLQSLARRYSGAAGLLLDGHAAGELGGQGKPFDWTRARAAGKPLVLAGGLGAGNVGAAIEAARPYAVDVSSGIESAPGIKDSGKMSAFVDAVRRADHELPD